MSSIGKLTLVKMLHTLVWMVFVALIFYVLLSGTSGKITSWSWLAAGAVVGEGLVLLIFKGHCPLTGMARRYAGSSKANFDIFLPEWLAQYNKLIFSAIYAAGLLLMLLQYPDIRRILIWAGISLISLIVAMVVMAISGTLTLPPGTRKGIPAQDLDEAVKRLAQTGRTGWDLVAYATLFVHKRMQYCRRNSFDHYSRAFKRGYGYCQQQAFALTYLLRQSGFNARAVHSLRVKLPGGRTVSHAWVEVSFQAESKYFCAVFPDPQTGMASFRPVGKVHPYTPFFRILAGWGSPAVNAIRYYFTGKDF